MKYKHVDPGSGSDNLNIVVKCFVEGGKGEMFSIEEDSVDVRMSWHRENYADLNDSDLYFNASVLDHIKTASRILLTPIVGARCIAATAISYVDEHCVTSSEGHIGRWGECLDCPRWKYNLIVLCRILLHPERVPDMYMTEWKRCVDRGFSATAASSKASL